VREALDLIEGTLPQAINIEAKLRAGGAAIRGDPTQVHQVVMNLATNAVQAMSSGGTLRVSLDTRHIDRPRRATRGKVAAADYLVLQVADNGAGIPAPIMEQIFDPFFTTKKVSVGTGLGLALVHDIVSEAGGALDVSSGPGRGTVFTVYLPRTGNAPKMRPKKAPRRLVPTGRVHREHGRAWDRKGKLSIALVHRPAGRAPTAS
jgi:signal transduction histidine kinase